ncbi:MAG TPA: biopolymer transporter ExbD [Pyrinomonadaceae bacterium]|nr:biopolymer transporter ExbD [Pyrinomonadaceae bacterium]
MNKPNINVTPLIDVLLVLLIIFMVVSPLKPSSFKTKVPSEPKNNKNLTDNPYTLVVTVNSDSTLSLNHQAVGTTNESAALVALLKDTFAARIANGNISESFGDDPERPMSDRIERTVFIKAPTTISYGSVARVVDAAKLAGAYPISLQIDRLD